MTPARVPDAKWNPGKTVVLVGLMGAGKTCVGRGLARRYGLPFFDADAEIETAAGCSIPDLFARYGEAAFRSGERRVIARLLDGSAHVLATGGGAFLDPETRARVLRRTISVWLRAGLDVLVGRVGRGSTRPLLRGQDPREVLERLIAERYPVYAEADIAIEAVREKPARTVARVDDAIRAFAAGPAP